MKSVFIILIVLVLCLLSKNVERIAWTDAKAANKQMLIQFVIYTLIYILLIIVSSVLQSTGLFLYLIGMDVMSVYFIYRLSSKAIQGNRISVSVDNSKPLLKIIAFTWYGLFMTMCCLNYSFAVMIPDSYEDLSSLNTFEKAFNVVYYTFSVMLTYAGNIISAKTTFTRAVEMIEVVCCYVIIGIVITNIIGKATDVSSQNTN